MKLSDLLLTRWLYKNPKQNVETKDAVYDSYNAISQEGSPLLAGSAAQDINTGNVPVGVQTIGGVPPGSIAVITDQTANAVPGSLTISSTTITGALDGTQTATVVLTWTAISGATFDHYVIRFKKHANTYYTYLTSTVNTIAIDSLVPNTSYDYGVASVNKYGTASAFSADVTGTTATSTSSPAAVTGVTAMASIQSVILKWTNNTESDLSFYNIYRETTNNPPGTLIGSVKTNYFVDGGLTGGQAYYYWIKAINTSGLFSPTFSTVATATPRNVASSDTNIATRGWTQTSVFSVGSASQVNWAAGVFTASDGTSYSIGAGNTGIMSAKTFIYLDIAVSTVAYQVSTTAVNAVGDGKVLIAVAQNNTTEAIFQVFGGVGGANWKGTDIVTGSITTNEIAANTIVAGNIAAGTITATQIDTATITSLSNLVIGAPQVLIDGSVTFLNTWLSYKGAYDAGTTYKKGDQVFYSTKYWSYINATPSAGNTPAENSYWTENALQIVTIDGGKLTANTVTTTQLNFVPILGSNVIASINASSEGIRIDADNIAISGSTTFSPGYDPSEALAEAQSKAQVFTAEPTTPYYVNDLWTNGVFLKKCETGRLTGAYQETDWVYATGYTDDTVANSKIKTFAQDSIPTSVSAGDMWIDTNDENKLYRAVIAGADEIKAGEWVLYRDSGIATAIQDAADAQSTADGKIITFAQASIPTSTDVGDMWIDTDDGNKLYRAASIGADQIAAGEWEPFRDTTIADAQSTADGKIVSFFQAGIPTSEGVGDLWFDTDDGNRCYRAAIIGADQIAVGEWELAPDQNKLGGAGSAAVGGSYASSDSGARVLIFPDANTGLQVIDDNGADVFKCIIGGTNIGDVQIGNWGGGQGILYDKSAGTTTFAGNILGVSGTFGTVTAGLLDGCDVYTNNLRFKRWTVLYALNSADGWSESIAAGASIDHFASNIVSLYSGEAGAARVAYMECGSFGVELGSSNSLPLVFSKSPSLECVAKTTLTSLGFASLGIATVSSDNNYLEFIFQISGASHRVKARWKNSTGSDLTSNLTIGGVAVDSSKWHKYRIEISANGDNWDIRFYIDDTLVNTFSDIPFSSYPGHNFGAKIDSVNTSSTASMVIASAIFQQDY